MRSSKVVNKSARVARHEVSSISTPRFTGPPKQVLCERILNCHKGKLNTQGGDLISVVGFLPCLPSPKTTIHHGIHKGRAATGCPRLYGGGRRPSPLWMGAWGLDRQRGNPNVGTQSPTKKFKYPPRQLKPQYIRPVQAELGGPLWSTNLSS